MVHPFFRLISELLKITRSMIFSCFFFFLAMDESYSVSPAIFSPSVFNQAFQDSISEITPVKDFPGLSVRTDSLVPSETRISYFSTLFSNIGNQALAPFHFDKKEWLLAGSSVACALVLIGNDGELDEFFKVQKKDHKWVADISPVVTRFGGDIGMYSVIGAGVFSACIKDRKGLETSLLASQGIITSGIWTRMIKMLSGRERPFASYYYSKTEGGHWYGPLTSFNRNLSSTKHGSSFDSFPSGHTATAFSIATVVANMYKDQKIVPVISYSMATLVGLSRMTEHEHWASDVFVGGLLGYVCGNQVVSAFNKANNPDLSEIKPESREKVGLSFITSKDQAGVCMTF